MGNIRQHLFVAFAYNAAGVPIAAGVRYPFFVSVTSAPRPRAIDAVAWTFRSELVSASAAACG